MGNNLKGPIPKWYELIKRKDCEVETEEVKNIYRITENHKYKEGGDNISNKRVNNRECYTWNKAKVDNESTSNEMIVYAQYKKKSKSNNSNNNWIGKHLLLIDNNNNENIYTSPFLLACKGCELNIGKRKIY